MEWGIQNGWALDGPIPFVSEVCRMAGTVHLGNTLKKFPHRSNALRKKTSRKTICLLAQQSLFDESRV